MLCLPETVPGAIAAVEKAIDEKKLSWDDINAKLNKVLHAKYHLGLSNGNLLILQTSSMI
jgi:hypothetical protein